MTSIRGQVLSLSSKGRSGSSGSLSLLSNVWRDKVFGNVLTCETAISCFFEEGKNGQIPSHEDR